MISLPAHRFPFSLSSLRYALATPPARQPHISTTPPLIRFFILQRRPTGCRWNRRARKVPADVVQRRAGARAAVGSAATAASGESALARPVVFEGRHPPPLSHARVCAKLCCQNDRFPHPPPPDLCIAPSTVHVTPDHSLYLPRFPVVRVFLRHRVYVRLIKIEKGKKIGRALLSHI